MSKRTCIEVIGSLNYDLVTTTPRIPGAGETLTARSFQTGLGGKGVNQAVACARLSRSKSDPESDIDVKMAGAVGDDLYGTELRKYLSDEGIDVEAVLVKEGYNSGIANIIVEEKTGENRIMLSTGANYAIAFEDIQMTSDFSVVVYQLEIPHDVVFRSIKSAKDNKKIVILNPAPAVPLPDEVFQGLDYLIVNESEASILSGVSEDELIENLDSTCELFINKGTYGVVITLGGKGVYWHSLDRQEAKESGVMIAARKVNVVDTTAAGDTFVGGFAVKIARDTSDMASAVDFANRAASIAVQKLGTQAAIPFSDQIAD